MTRILATIALRLAVCAGISWAVWRWLGLSSMVPTLGLFGILLARPLLDLAGVLWGATTLAIRATSLSLASAEKTLFYQLAVSALLLLVAALWVGAPLPDRLSALAWGSLAFQTVIVSFASYLVWFWLMRHYPATPLASFTMLTPVFGLILGAALLAEPVTARLLIALATVAGGIFLVNRRTP